MKKTIFGLCIVIGIIGIYGLFTLCSIKPYTENINTYTDKLTDLPVDNILVQKSKRIMFLRHGDKVVRAYNISLGKQPVGAKTRRGDNKTPEGKYRIVSHNPHSAYHLSLKISYPTEKQKQQAQKNRYSAGNDIMIHGWPNRAPNLIFAEIHRKLDWTAGCIAVTDTEIEEIYELVKDDTPIVIEP
ncbi:MAG: L,D-transpeptidase family protein [Alphaproteobacteria bacterium]